jgi:hypothetical protein
MEGRWFNILVKLKWPETLAPFFILRRLFAGGYASGGADYYLALPTL